MVKRILLFLYFAIASTSFIKAGEYEQHQQKAGIGGSEGITDTTGLKDSAALVVNDPKKDFKDLFEDAGSTGISTARLNPKALNFVQDYIETHTDNLTKMKDWAMPYFNMMDGVLEKHGIPKELKYLCVIESNMKSTALSHAGARGPWQFMPETARRLGLKVGKKVDERTDYFKSTHAAARYLTELYGIYGDWLLVIAAYNGGPGNVNKAMKRSGSVDFWSLQNYLPAESRKHVKKFIATHYIMEGQGGLTTLTKEETKNLLFASQVVPSTTNINTQETVNLRTLTISGKYNSMVIAKHLTMDISEFNRLNPDFDNKLSTSGNYDLRLSPEKMDLFLANKFKILNESVQVMLNSANAAAKN